MILLGIIVLAGLVAAASRSGKYTLPFMIMVLVVIFFFKRFERYFSGSETAWRNFRDNAEGTTLDKELVQIERELTGETIEWSEVLITDSYLLWPRTLENNGIIRIAEITRLFLDERDSTRLMAQTIATSQSLLLTSVEAEIGEIVTELSARHPTLEIDPELLLLLKKEEYHGSEDPEEG
jgi:hypothetical protein